MIIRTLLALSILSLTACDTGQTPAENEASEVAVSAPEGEPTESDKGSASAEALKTAIAGAWRSNENKARDTWRNPAETLAFFGVEPDDTVIEIWPGRGWYTQILAPYLNSGGGKLIAAVWDTQGLSEERAARYESAIDKYKSFFAESPEIYGNLQYVPLGESSGSLGEAASVDVVLTFRNVHNWMGNSYEAKVFEDAYAVLKPGGVLGVVEHRLPSSDLQDPLAKSGYVHEDYVKALAERAGFQFDLASEINANPADKADHPFGVWTLPPASRTSDRDGNTPDGFDAEIYKAIGESDRMTLRFVKPLTEN